MGRKQKQIAMVGIVAVGLMVAPGTLTAQEPDTFTIREECRCDAPAPMISYMMRRLGGERVMIGVTLEVTPDSETNEQGVRILEVTAGGPAAEAGLRAGDVITSIDGHDLTRAIDDEEEQGFSADQPLPAQRLSALVRELEAGEPVEISYIRGDRTATATVVPEVMASPMAIAVGPGGRVSVAPRGGTVAPAPDAWPEPGPQIYRFRGEPRLEWREQRDRDRAEELLFELREHEGDATVEVRPRGEVRGLRSIFFGAGSCEGGVGFMSSEELACVDGVRMIRMNEGLGEYFGVDQGVLVTDSEEESTLGLRAGDVILLIGDREVKDPGHAARILASYEKDEQVSMTVRRNGRETTVTGVRH
jgi:hypothetical protein